MKYPLVLRNSKGLYCVFRSRWTLWPIWFKEEDIIDDMMEVRNETDKNSSCYV
jgi:hypothetical protein